MTIVDPREAAPEHLEHRIATPDGRTLAVAEWGDPDGVALLAVHGTPGSRISWWEDPTIYARHGLRRLSVDRAGYGDSTRSPGRAVVDFVADVAAGIAALREVPVESIAAATSANFFRLFGIPPGGST